MLFASFVVKSFLSYIGVDSAWTAATSERASAWARWASMAAFRLGRSSCSAARSVRPSSSTLDFSTMNGVPTLQRGVRDGGELLGILEAVSRNLNVGALVQ